MTDRLTICWPCFTGRRGLIDAVKTYGPNGYCAACYPVWVESHLRAAVRGTAEWRRGVALRLDAAVVRSGMSRGQVAEAAGIAPSRLSDFTRHDLGGNLPVRIPLKRLLALCDVLGTTPNDILGYAPAMVPLEDGPKP